MNKLISKSRIYAPVKSGAKFRSKTGDTRKGTELLLQAQSCWDSLRNFREERDRNKRYTYGDQWGDYIDYKGKKITEEEWIRKQGGIPLKNNLIRRLVRTMIGIYRSQDREPICVANDREEQSLGETMSTALQVNNNLNKLSEVMSRTFEEFLISGCAITKEVYDWRHDKMDCFTDQVNPNMMFFDPSMIDVRHWDLSMIGEVHDLSFTQLCSVFASSNAEFEEMRAKYSNAKEWYYAEDREQRHQIKNISFLTPYDTNKIRVVEVWRKEEKPRYRCHDILTGEWYKVEIKDRKRLVDNENEARISEGTAQGMEESDIPLIEAEWYVDAFWKYYFILPHGEIIREGETPYDHKGHPYVLKLYPYIDGEIHSFVSDVIDQQRYVNNLITTNNFILKSSAKGALAMPEDCIPDSMTPEEFAEEWARPDGIILYKPSAKGNVPQQLSSKSTNIGIWEMLQLQINLMEEITGVQGSLQGKSGFAGQSAAMYNMQQQNAATSMMDLLESFSSFELDMANKKVKNIQQFYDGKRILNIAGKKASLEYDSEQIGDVDFDLNIIQSASSPTVRMLANDWLMQMFQQNAIGIKDLLEVGEFPFADRLLEIIKSNEEAMKNGGPMQGVPDEISEQVAKNADQNMVNKMKQAYGG